MSSSIGESEGVNEGGVLTQVTREVNVEALPMEVPDHLELDISAMRIGDSVRAADIRMPEGATLLDDPDETVIATVTPPTKVEIPEPEVEEEEAELVEGEVPEEELPEGAEQPAEPERPPASRRPRSRRCGSFVGARRPRRSTCSSRVSATPAASTHERGTTSASWSATSWRGDTAARFARSSPASSPSCGSTERRLALLKPQTYVNESGRAVGAAARFFKVPAERLLVLHDEVDLELGRLQVRLGGGLAGHNGLRSVAQHLKTQDFLRLRIGVGRPERGDPRPVSDYVLCPFEAHEDADGLVARAADAVETIVRDGLEEAQNRFNERP